MPTIGGLKAFGRVAEISDDAVPLGPHAGSDRVPYQWSNLWLERCYLADDPAIDELLKVGKQSSVEQRVNQSPLRAGPSDQQYPMRRLCSQVILRPELRLRIRTPPAPCGGANSAHRQQAQAVGLGNRPSLDACIRLRFESATVEGQRVGV